MSELRTYETVYDGFGSDVVRYEATDIDDAMRQYIADVEAALPGTRADFDQVNIVDGEVVSSYERQPFQTGTVFLVEVDEQGD